MIVSLASGPVHDRLAAFPEAFHPAHKTFVAGPSMLLIAATCIVLLIAIGRVLILVAQAVAALGLLVLIVVLIAAAAALFAGRVGTSQQAPLRSPTSTSVPAPNVRVNARQAVPLPTGRPGKQPAHTSPKPTPHRTHG